MRVSVGMAGVLALVTACGGGSDNGTTGAGNNSGSPSVVAVSVVDYAYSPASLSIRAGTTVKWTNDGPSEHTATSNTGIWNSGALSAPSGGGGYYGGTSSPGGSYQYTFNTAGTYDYHCSFHPQITGTVTVTP